MSSSLSITFVGGFGLAILLIFFAIVYSIGKDRGKTIGFSLAYSRITGNLYEIRKQASALLWTSVDDWLPPFDELVVVYDCNRPELGVCVTKRIDMNYLCARLDEHKFMVFNNDMNITHWLVIPNKPQPDNNK